MKISFGERGLKVHCTLYMDATRHANGDIRSEATSFDVSEVLCPKLLSHPPTSIALIGLGGL